MSQYDRFGMPRHDIPRTRFDRAAIALIALLLVATVAAAIAFSPFNGPG